MIKTGWPKITIVTPSYNQGAFIEEAIRSVLLQGYPNLEYIIIDGKSTDNSVEIIKKYKDWITYWVSEEDKGQSDAINKGFSKATGEIFAWLNSDDVLLKGTLQKVGRYRTTHPNCHFLTGDGEYRDSTLKKTRYYIRANAYSLEGLFYYHRGQFLPQPSVFFSSEAFRNSGGLDRRLTYAMDLDLWFRLIEKYPLSYIPTCLSMLRCHKDAKTLNNNDVAIKEVREVITKYIGSASHLRRFLIKTGLGFYYAQAICWAGLAEYFNKNRSSAKKALKRALKVSPAVLFLPPGPNLYLRLALPENIKRLIFSKP